MAGALNKEALRSLPSIDTLIQSPALDKWNQKIIRSIRVQIAQRVVSRIREEIKKGADCPNVESVEKKLEAQYEGVLAQHMVRVINATGVVLHTNLGRAPLGQAVLEQMQSSLWGYCTLEYSLAKGDRGSRTQYIESLIKLVCGVPAAIVVNNNAGATFLMLHALARGKEAIISRGELVQIGGGFRVPEILEASGAILKEVGTTNMTSLKDYESAISANTGMVLKVHQSNFYISGHTKVPHLADLIKVGNKHGVLVGVDLGSGCLISQDLDREELTVPDVVRMAPDLICFSGDKLLGGPQAGIIVGESQYIEVLKKSPLYRALRLGKTELYMLEQTLLNYVQGKSAPIWDLLNQSAAEIRKRAESIKKELESFAGEVRLVEGNSGVGGGTMPATQLPTCLIELSPKEPESFAKRLRSVKPAVIVRMEKKRVLIDLRTVFAEEQSELVDGLRKAWN